jgi:hypothetical protein
MLSKVTVSHMMFNLVSATYYTLLCYIVLNALNFNIYKLIIWNDSTMNNEIV